MKNFKLTLLAVVLFGIACNNSQKNVNVQEIKGKTNTFKLDTIGILTNKNLDSLILYLEKAELKESKNIADIPAFIRKTLNKLTKDDFSIANPNENWQSTDVVFNKNLPYRQLIYLGNGKTMTLIVYYRGGFGKSTHILIIKHKNEEITDLWCGVGFKIPDNKEKIIEFIKSHKDKHWGLNTNMIYF